MKGGREREKMLKRETKKEKRREQGTEKKGEENQPGQGDSERERNDPWDDEEVGEAKQVDA